MIVAKIEHVSSPPSPHDVVVVAVPPMIVDYTQPVELTRTEGELVELFCNATGVPNPTVTWYRMNSWAGADRERE